MSVKINFKPLTIFSKISILYAWPGCEMSFDACTSSIQQWAILLSCEIWYFILLHTLHQIRSKSRKVCISTVDTDVIVIALSKFYELSTVDLGELWVEFGVGVNQKWITVHRLAQSLSPPKCGAFPSWYALTGCDTVSSFLGSEKKSVWETWKCYPEATEVFLELSNPVDGVLSDNSIFAMEMFICLMCDKTT